MHSKELLRLKNMLHFCIFRVYVTNNARAEFYACCLLTALLDQNDCKSMKSHKYQSGTQCVRVCVCMVCLCVRVAYVYLLF